MKRTLTGLLLLTLTLSGCGPTNGMPESGIVTGTVRYKGQPVSGATVVFHSASSPKQNGAALTTADGSYKVFDAPPGETFVVVQSPLPGAGADDGKPGYARAIPKRAKVTDAPDELRDKGAAKPPKPLTLPKKYAEVGSTDLKFTVKAGREQSFDIDLVD